MQDDKKRIAALHRKQNSEIGLQKSETLLSKVDLIQEKSPKNGHTMMQKSDTPNSSRKERKSRKQRLTRISEQNADNILNSLSYASEMKEEDQESDGQMAMMSPLGSD